MAPLLRWIWVLLPANPVVLRTVWSGSHRMRHQWIRLGYLSVLVGLTALGLLTGGALQGRVSLTELAKSGTYVFAIIGYGQMVLICLLAPLFMGGAIASEQSGKTYDLLLATPMSNFQIVLGSLVGRLFFILALLASGLPLFAVLLLFGGVPIGAVFVCFATSAATALLVGAVAITLSVMRAGGRKAVFIFVICVGTYLVAGAVLDVLVLRRATAAPGATTWMTPLHPLLVLEASMGSADYVPPAADTLGDHHRLVRWYLSRPFAAFCSLSLCASLILVLWCTIMLRRINQGHGPLATWLRRAIGRGRGRDGEKRHEPRRVHGNPIAWRESHTRSSRAGGLLARAAMLGGSLLATVVLLALLHSGSMSRPRFHLALTTLLLIQIATICLTALYMSAGTVSAEREDGRLDLLLTTPMTERQYIWGKLRGLVRFLAVILGAPLLTTALVAIYALSDRTRAKPLMLWEVPILLLLLLVPFVAVCIVVGMNMSLRSRRVLGAVAQAVAVMGIVVVILGFCGWPAAQNIPFLGVAINAFSPTTAVVMLIEPWDRIKGFHHDLHHRIQLFVATLIAAGVYSLIVHAMIQSMVKGFDHTLRKLSGTD